MAKVPPKNQLHDAKVRREHGLSITGIRYVSSPDAEARLSRAIDILLGAATQKKLRQHRRCSRGKHGEHKTKAAKAEGPDPDYPSSP